MLSQVQVETCDTGTPAWPTGDRGGCLPPFRARSMLVGDLMVWAAVRSSSYNNVICLF